MAGALVSTVTFAITRSIWPVGSRLPVGQLASQATWPEITSPVH